MSDPVRPDQMSVISQTPQDVSVIDPVVLSTVMELSKDLGQVLEHPEQLQGLTLRGLSEYITNLLVGIAAHENADPYGIYQRVHDVLGGMGTAVAAIARDIHERPSGPEDIH